MRRLKAIYINRKDNSSPPTLHVIPGKVDASQAKLLYTKAGRIKISVFR